MRPLKKELSCAALCPRGVRAHHTSALRAVMHGLNFGAAAEANEATCNDGIADIWMACCYIKPAHLHTHVPYTHTQHTPHTHTPTHIRLPQSEVGNPKNSPNELTSIRLSTVLVFLVGMGQLLCWTVALIQKSVVLSHSGVIVVS